MNIILISHCGLSDNSGMHVASIACELVRRGHQCLVLVPDGSLATDPLGTDLPFRTLEFQEIESESRPWSAGWAPDLIHVWSPREHVRRATRSTLNKTPAPVVIHMEDNEEQITLDRLASQSYDGIRDHLSASISATLSHPDHYREFIGEAAGYTCLIDRLLEFKPSETPGVVFWPGFDEKLIALKDADQSTRKRYDIQSNDVVILYSGNVHQSNIGDVRELYYAVSLLKWYGTPIKLIKTGQRSNIPILSASQVDECVLDLGFVNRAEISTLLSLADVLVQPGSSSRYNDYRFPAKLPEYLVSGRPVILPDTNIGRHLQDGRDVLKLSTGTRDDIAEKIRRVLSDPDLAEKLAENGRKYALEHLTWKRAVDVLEPFYEEVIARSEMDMKTNSAGKK